MTPEEIKSLIEVTVQASIAPALKSGLAQFADHFKKELAPIAARLDEFEAIVTEPDPTPDKADTGKPAAPETAALMERLAKMEQLEQSRQAELRSMKLETALGSAVGKHNPLHQDIVKEILSTRYGSKAVEKDGEWYLPNGSKLGEEVDTFFATEAGQHFITNPAGTSLGTQSAKQPATTPKSAKDMTSDEMLAAMIL
jgi:hypothetical protein